MHIINSEKTSEHMRHFCLTLALTMEFLLVTTAQTEEKPFAPYTFTSVQSGMQSMKNNVSVKKFAARKCSIAPTHKYKKKHPSHL